MWFQMEGNSIENFHWLITQKITKLNSLIILFLATSRSSRLEVFFKKVSLKISQNSQENTSVKVSLLIALQVSGRQLEKYLARTETYLDAKHLRSNSFVKLVNNSQPLTIFVKKMGHRLVKQNGERISLPNIFLKKNYLKIFEEFTMW